MLKPMLSKKIYFCLLTVSCLLAENNNVFLPIVFSSPETGTGYGLTHIYLNKTETAQLNQIQTMLVGTEKQQSGAYLNFNQHLPNSDWLLRGSLEASDTLRNFYGIGNYTTARNSEIYYYTQERVTLTMLNPYGKIRLGPKIDLENLRIKQLQEDGLLDKDGVTGAKGYKAQGIGWELEIDERDNPIYSKTGYYLNNSTLFYTNQFGSDYQFTIHKFDYRFYQPLTETQTLAHQAYLQAGLGQIPFTAMGMVGDTILRGYPHGRYMDNCYLAWQSEYRYPLADKISGTVFYSIGQVSPKLADLSINDFKNAYGFGLRYNIGLPTEPINLRFDLAFQEEGSNFYLAIMEAF